MRTYAGLAILLVVALVSYKGIGKTLNPDPEPALATNDNYHRIRIGMSEREVRSILGSPSGTVRGTNGKGARAAMWQNGKMTLLPAEGADISELTVDNGWILEAQGASPVKARVKHKSWSKGLTIDNLVPASSVLFFTNKGEWAHMGYLGHGFSYHINGQYSFSGRRPHDPSELEVWGKMRGTGALWQGVDQGRISVVFEDGGVIFKSYHRPPSDPSTEGDLAGLYESHPGESKSGRP